MNLKKILSGFNKTLKQLDALVSKNNELIAANDVKCTALDRESMALAKEAKQAAAIGENIKELLGGTSE